MEDLDSPPHRGPAELVCTYPAELVCTVRARDGTVLHIRPVRADDGERLTAFHAGLSAQSVYRRFFFAHPRLTDAEVERFTNVDYKDRLALVVIEDDRLTAVGRYERVPGTEEAEVAFVVADACQHNGIATLLLEQLASAALDHGITAFVAETLSENHEMLGVFMKSGFRVTTSADLGTVTVRFPIDPDDGYQKASGARHHQLAADPRGSGPRGAGPRG